MCVYKGAKPIKTYISLNWLFVWVKLTQCVYKGAKFIKSCISLNWLFLVGNCDDDDAAISVQLATEISSHSLTLPR